MKEFEQKLFFYPAGAWGDCAVLKSIVSNSDITDIVTSRKVLITLIESDSDHTDHQIWFWSEQTNAFCNTAARLVMDVQL